MLIFYIHGIKDGQHDVNLTASVEEVRDMYPEFFGEVTLTGTLRKIGKRYTFNGTAECKAKLICDLSLEEFVEVIKVDLNLSYLADSYLLRLKESGNNSGKEVKEIIIHEDDTTIDFSSEVREEFAVNLPMKRIAPAYREKSFDEVYPQYSANANGYNSKLKSSKKDKKKIDDRWSKLANLKLN